MKCPKCDGEFERSQYGAKIIVQRCQGCGGILTDPKTLEFMRKEWMAEVMIDRGKTSVGRQMNKLDQVPCPSCSKPMGKIFDDEQPHVWLESCKDCDLLFLDAGELTDLSKLTLFDKVRDLFCGA